MILFSDLGVGLGWSTAVLVFFNSGISILTDFRNTFRVKNYCVSHILRTLWFQGYSCKSVIYIYKTYCFVFSIDVH